jgi:hypothetical protein
MRGCEWWRAACADGRRCAHLVARRTSAARMLECGAEQMLFCSSIEFLIEHARSAQIQLPLQRPALAQLLRAGPEGSFTFATQHGVRLRRE